eukprot:m.14072 g.14072  ORF g.14072 m.14072 type:complete len:407 (+) comp25480_c0_seq1:254-1474(+)
MAAEDALHYFLSSYLASATFALVIFLWILNVFSWAEKPQILYCTARKTPKSDFRPSPEEIVVKCPILAQNYTPPTLWGRSSHIQTLLFGLIGRFSPPQPERRRKVVLSSDGAKVIFDLFGPKETSLPVLLVCPGIAGSSDSSSIRVFVSNACSFGHSVAVLNHVGVAQGVRLSARRLFTYGGTEDFDVMVQSVKKEFPGCQLIAVGYSMGANIVVKYLGEEPSRQKEFLCAISSCQGYDITKTKVLLRQWEQGRRFYNFLITKNCLKIVKRHADDLFDEESCIKTHKERVLSATSLLDIDEFMQRRLHGYDSVDDYYEDHSSCSHMNKITEIPLLLVNAADDPLIPECLVNVAKEYAMSHSNALFIQTKHGGHLGFFEGGFLLPNTVSWIDRLAMEFIQAVVSKNE